MDADRSAQAEFDLFGRQSAANRNADWLVEFLSGRDWITATEILVELKMPVTENAKRVLRRLADLSCGRICGHQKGYKLATSMTNEEYQWWRGEWLKASASIKSRVIESDRVFYSRLSAKC